MGFQLFERFKRKEQDKAKADNKDQQPLRIRGGCFSDPTLRDRPRNSEGTYATPGYGGGGWGGGGGGGGGGGS